MLADAFANLFAAETIDPIHPRDPALAKLFNVGDNTMAGVQVNAEQALGLSPFWRGVNIIGNGVAKPGFAIYRRTPDGKEFDRDHPSWRVVAKQANDWQSASALRKLLIQHALIWGNGLAWIIRDQAGAPMELLPLLPDRTGMMVVDGEGLGIEPKDIEPSENQTLIYYTRLRTGIRSILPSNVLHFRGLSFNGIWGLPVIEILAETLGSAIAPRDFGARLFGQGAVPSAVVFMPPGLKDDQKGEYVKALRQKSEGLSRAHRLLVLENQSELKQLTIPPEQAQMLGTMEFKIRDISNILGCQAHKLGDTTRKSFNSLEQSNQEHLDDDLDPWLQVCEEEEELKLLRDEERDQDTHFIEANRKALERTNLASRTQHYASGRQWGYYSANDVRRKENEPSIGTQGDMYLVPANMTPANQVATAPADQRSASRLAYRLQRESAEQARKGGREFQQWLERLPDPAILRPELAEVVDCFQSRLAPLLDPPYVAADLETNVADALKHLENGKP